MGGDLFLVYMTLTRYLVMCRNPLNISVGHITTQVVTCQTWSNAEFSMNHSFETRLTSEILIGIWPPPIEWNRMRRTISTRSTYYSESVFLEDSWNTHPFCWMTSDWKGTTWLIGGTSFGDFHFVCAPDRKSACDWVLQNIQSSGGKHVSVGQACGQQQLFWQHIYHNCRFNLTLIQSEQWLEIEHHHHCLRRSSGSYLKISAI